MKKVFLFLWNGFSFFFMFFMYLSGFTLIHGVIIGVVVLPFLMFFNIDADYYKYILFLAFISALIRTCFTERNA